MSHKYSIIISLFLLGFTCTSPKVIGVTEGDTMKVLVNKQTLTIRLRGIDCPELNQPYGQKAKNFTTKECYGKEVKVVTFGQDKIGNTIAEVFLPNGRMLNHELVRNGFAWHDKQNSNDSTLFNLEAEARKQKLGLWYDSNPVAPWDFGKKKEQLSKK